MSSKQKFFSQLQDLYVGARLDGKGGMAKLLQFKCQYFEKIKPLIEAEIKKNFPDTSDKRLPELYEKLYTFFSSYLTSGGSVYFNDTPAYKNVYAKVYFDKEDVALFYKTKDLYYVKSQVMYQSVENLTFNQGDKLTGVYFDFDASDYLPSNNNIKEKVLILFTGVKNRKIQFKVIEQSQILDNSEVGIIADEQLKEASDAVVYTIKKTNHQLLEDTVSFYAIDFDKKKEARSSTLKFLGQNKQHTTEEIINKAINIYKKQNEVDYFIHKNPKGFLSEQFNLFMYNYLSNDMDSLLDQQRLNNIRKIKQIAFVVIDYIAKFEDELVKIWNKPKFVRGTNYVVTLDKLIAKGLDIGILTAHAGMSEQIKEWQELGMIDCHSVLDTESLKNILAEDKYQYLPFDTKHFDENIKYTILGLFDNLDEECDGVLIKSDNYQALNTLSNKYNEKVKCIYIDPPYNTGNDGFIYADGYNHATWLAMMENRLVEARDKLSDDGAIFISIDDNEVHNLKLLCDSVFGRENFSGEFIVNSTPNGRDYGNVAKQHEHVLFYTKNHEEIVTNLLSKDVSFKFKDSISGFNIHPLYNSNESFHRTNRPNLYYPFYLNPVVKDKDGFYEISLVKKSGLIEIYPPLSQKNSVQFVWRWGKELSSDNLNKEIIGHQNENGEYRIVQKMRNSEKLIRSLIINEAESNEVEPSFLILDKSVSNRKGTAEVEALFDGKIFSFPKPTSLIGKFLYISTTKNDIILDFFAGSGTTGHATINLNREDDEHRKYILVEMGAHFDNVVLPRIKKVIFTDKWKDGKAQENNSISQLVKYYSLEQYEDVLDKAAYNYIDDNVANLAYNFSNNEKLAHDGLHIDDSKESNPIRYSFEKLYTDVDVWESISNFYGYKIKQYHSSDKVTYLTRENREVTLSKDEITFDNMPELKSLVWW